jgi:hypothetical protein
MADWRRPSYYHDRTRYTTRAALEHAFTVDRDHPYDTAYAQGQDLVSRLAHLIDVLHDKGVLSIDDVRDLLDGSFEVVE